MAAIAPIASAFAVISPIVKVLSAGASVYGALQAPREQANIVSFNAVQARNQAEMERQAGLIREQGVRRQTGQLLGEQVTGFAKAGVKTEGTPLQVMMESAKQAELEALTARYTGESRAFTQGQEALLYEKTANQLRRSSLVKAGTAGMSAFSRLLV